MLNIFFLMNKNLSARSATADPPSLQQALLAQSNLTLEPNRTYLTPSSKTIDLKTLLFHSNPHPRVPPGNRIPQRIIRPRSYTSQVAVQSASVENCQSVRKSGVSETTYPQATSSKQWSEKKGPVHTVSEPGVGESLDIVLIM
jgi:hypothetical protein